MRVVPPGPAVTLTTGPGRGSGCPGRSGHPADVVGPQRGGVERVHTALTGGVTEVVVVPHVTGRIVVRPEGVALSVETGLRAEGGVLGEQLAAVIGVQVELEVRMPQIAAGRVLRLERPARAVGQAGPHDPGRVGLVRRG